MDILILSVAVYFLIVFLVLRWIVPFMGFKKPEVPSVLPEDMESFICQTELESGNGQEYLFKVYEFVRQNWRSDRFKTILRFPLAFRTDLNEIWKERGYAHCTTANYVLFVLLAGSKFFKPEDIKFRHEFLNFFIHQYLQVRVEGKWQDADPGGSNIGKFGLGSHVSFFR